MSRTKYQWGYEVDDPVLNHPILQIQADHKQLGQVLMFFRRPNIHVLIILVLRNI